MADHVLNPSKETAAAILYQANLLKLMGNKTLADKSAKRLIEAAERLEAAHGGVQALNGARIALKEAEDTLNAAEAQDVAERSDAKKRKATEDKHNERQRAEIEQYRTTSQDSRKKLDTRATVLAASERVVAERTKALDAAETDLSMRLVEADKAVKAANRREKAAGAAGDDFRAKVKAMKLVTGG